MCECVKSSSVIAGWGCHRCHVYNGLQRLSCRQCSEKRRLPLSPDRVTGETFETYDEAYADDPNTLDLVRQGLAQVGAS